MKRLSAADIGNLTCKVRVLLRVNRRLRGDLRVARRALTRGLVRRGRGEPPWPDSYSRRAAQYALILIRHLEMTAELKQRYYESLLESPCDLAGHSVEDVRDEFCARARRRIGEEKPRIIPLPPLVPATPRLLLALQTLGRATLRLGRDLMRPWGERLDRLSWGREWNLFTRHGAVLVGRALEVGAALDVLLGTSRWHPWGLERIRLEIIRNAGSHFDPQMVEAVVDAWDQLITFSNQRHAA